LADKAGVLCVRRFTPENPSHWKVLVNKSKKETFLKLWEWHCVSGFAQGFGFCQNPKLKPN
jgi:hypothetical protein